MKTEPNEPINSSTETYYYGSEDQFSKQIFHEGLTKREYFASIAMQSTFGIERESSDSHELDIVDRVALRSVRMADALINALNKEDL